MFGKSVNNMKPSAVCHDSKYSCSKASSVCELADLADCGFVDDWKVIQLLPHFNTGWIYESQKYQITTALYISSVNGLEPWPYFAMASPWHVGVGKYSVQTCSDRQCQGYSWILLPCRTYVNPSSVVDMLSMSKQPQVATKTCPFRGVKRKKRRRCWKIATPSPVICHGSMPWGFSTPFSDLFLWKRCFHEFCDLKPTRKAIGMFSSFGWLWIKEIIIKKTRTDKNMLTCFKFARVGWLGSMNHWP